MILNRQHRNMQLPKLAGREPDGLLRATPSESPLNNSGQFRDRESAALINDLLAEQRELTAVEKFSRAHDAYEVRGQRYRDLLPATPPGPGQQFAFEVDLDKCSGCKACVTACHSLNGLDENETWRSVGSLWSSDGRKPLQQTVTTACHHCVDPGCLNGCPVLAYDKDPLTGIVRHLDDQCMGCSYCILKCPYDVPKYSETRGIVRKCDLCHGRLAVGEAPACVQACPNEAIRVTTVTTEAIRAEYAGGQAGPRGSGVINHRSTTPSLHHANPFLPDSPPPHITLPTTRYLTRKTAAELRSPAREMLQPEPAHWPLIWMLLLTQTGAGLFLFAALAPAEVRAALIVAGWLVLHAGLGASVFHLGRPGRAWRSFLGWRTSWMSREIIAFGVLSVLATTTTVLAFTPFAVWQAVSLAGTVFAGLLSVACSGMIYVDTRRPFWRAGDTFTRFFSSTLLLGAAAAACVAGWTDWLAGRPPGVAPALAFVALLVRAYQYAWHHRLLRRAGAEPEHPAHRCVRLIRARFGWILRARAGLFLVSTATGLLAMAGAAPAGPLWATISLVSTFASSVAQRYLFFIASLSTRMPGL